MIYLQIKVYEGKTLYTLNICQKTYQVINGKNVYKNATEYLSLIEYKTLLNSGLFVEKEKYVKE